MAHGGDHNILSLVLKYFSLLKCKYSTFKKKQ